MLNNQLIETRNILWLKRDLRTRDHAPLAAAVAAGVPFVVLYCFEPSIMASPKHSPRHWHFVAQSLVDLKTRGLPVTIYWGEVEEALDGLRAAANIATIFSHQETSHKLSFDRDRRVRDWTRQHGVEWQEFVQDGVIRGRKHRLGFAEKLDDFLALPPVHCNWQAAQILPPGESGLPIAKLADGFAKDFTQAKGQTALHPSQPGRYVPDPGPPDPRFQPGGETTAWRYLKSFTTERGRGYIRQIGNPSLSRRSCSRMSTYLAHGCVSLREVFQWAKSADIKPAFRKDMKMFRERLWWRAHYFQKLEAEWQIEFKPINRAFLKLGRHTSGPDLDAFRSAATGFPMIDANIRCLRATGWINFRSRAMLVTFATFVLWLDFRPVATFLGSLFLDYDPGIHYGQFQMQAGTTGYHPPRNYNPYLQGERYDKKGEFVHRWLPELRRIPAPWCHYPHRLTELERQLYDFSTTDYPAPIVDFAEATSENMDRYWAVRRSAEAQNLLPEIWAKHVMPESMEVYMAGEQPSPRRDV
ncbi:cryptochrome/deoxyribodipyrimidine photo-lyase family protein [Lewinella sp. 4G2]|uniref:cryptochrome/deoxyribodipyrimidine photo-lyase family protein n=1 Tax=Lewinella sp. 4G2 TaxID=1803372 RepID=UPI0007B4B4C4|nr:FAD-binding domain-containing protein [Lewinella sp. 4G2]OAV42599.1 hypothetical protein A3850_015240 [Lewinella sp. 4G2]